MAVFDFSAAHLFYSTAVWKDLRLHLLLATLVARLHLCFWKIKNQLLSNRAEEMKPLLLWGGGGSAVVNRKASTRDRLSDRTFKEKCLRCYQCSAVAANSILLDSRDITCVGCRWIILQWKHIDELQLWSCLHIIINAKLYYKYLLVIPQLLLRVFVCIWLRFLCSRHC